MRILLTNDDGLASPGLQALWRALEQAHHEVVVVVPEENRSGSSQAMTTLTAVSIHLASPATPNCWLVGGTPVDCVKLGLRHILDTSRPDLVLSGLNIGPNIGSLISYSGTVGAAFEGARAGLPSMALSLAGAAWVCPFATLAVELLKKMGPRFSQFHYGQTPPLYNVNFPCIPPETVKGVKIVAQGQSTLVDDFRRTPGPVPGAYRWTPDNRGWVYPAHAEAGDDDLTALRDGWIAVTPLTLQLTCERELTHLREQGPALTLDKAERE